MTILVDKVSDPKCGPVEARLLVVWCEAANGIDIDTKLLAAKWLLEYFHAEDEREDRARMAAAQKQSTGNGKSDLPITSLGFSTLLENILASELIDTIGDLVKYDARQLLNFRHIGQTKLCEVRETLKEHGLALKGEGPDEATRANS